MSSNSDNQTIDESFNGQQVKMTRGGLLQVVLQSNITTGFKWELTENSDSKVPDW
jgi:predicted secreted protein